MKICIVNVATGSYVRGQRRLAAHCEHETLLYWADELPRGSPTHSQTPYAFKAHALQHAAERGYELLLWCDASVVPIRPLDPLWAQIERDGYWVSRNGWLNAEWTAEAAYADLGVTPEENWKIPHVVATAFGLNVRHETGRRFLEEYLRLAGTGAFRGPWFNRNHPDYAHMPLNHRCAPCGGERVRGHRHDQTAASLIAWRLGMQLTDPPKIFSYRGGETAETTLVCDGSY